MVTTLFRMYHLVGSALFKKNDPVSQTFSLPPHLSDPISPTDKTKGCHSSCHRIPLAKGVVTKERVEFP